ncbi:hypothetical protein H2200_007507 [Cladophialophora chaetospira]|uniref:FAD/NAD(P)-binding domain-containing protein n=1 Tax=Cladophialophora chaetospira TaxID=386627 RepID=A0AA39CHJ1_9EURO|nr:hypothetical protein H2200_007507 [Cladophialophora chaetospira]
MATTDFPPLGTTVSTTGLETGSEVLQSKAEHAKLGFDPAVLKQKYIEERNKRIRDDGGVDQYRTIEGSLASYIEDPFAGKLLERASICEEIDVLVIGGGYGGQLVAVKQLEAGIRSIRIVEKGAEFGGTWYWNHYPGAQCDIESYIYMPLCEEVGFIPTEKYAHQQELLQHAMRIGRHYGLYDKTLFQTEVSTLRWDDSAARWVAQTDRGDMIRARFAICAAGPLHRPKLPGLPGIESFRGHSFHSSRWDFSYTGGDTTGNLTNLKNKRVAIIGTGATSVQIVPHLGRWASQVYVFQRTPSSVHVRGNMKTDPTWKHALRPGWQAERIDNFNTITSGGYQSQDLVKDSWTHLFAKKKIRSEVAAQPEEAAFQQQLADYEKMEEVRNRVDKTVKDRSVAQSLKPYYNIWCKRPCFHDEYLETFNRANVHLIDTKGQGIESIGPNGICANGQLFDVDCIIYATGFELATDWSHRSGVEIYGRGGQTITEKWEDGASTLHGSSTRNFPNCFFITIVQAGLTPNFIHMTAEQAAHFAYIVKTCKDRNIAALEPSEQAEHAWVEKILRQAESKKQFNRECTPGYYNNEGRPSEKTARNSSYGGGSLEFLKILREWREDGVLEGMDIDRFEVGTATE